MLGFFQNIGRACFDSRKIIVRLALVFCLYQALWLGFPSPAGWASSEEFYQTPGLEQNQEELQTGMGGGGYFEKNAAGEAAEAAWSLQTVEFEPEAFSRPRTLLYSSYTIQKGDIIGDVADGFGLNQDTILSINGIKNSRLIQIGQVLRIPNQDGIMYAVKNGDTLGQIAEKYSLDAESIRFSNELFSDTVLPGTALFIPGAQLGWMERQEINGDLFIWPAAGYITSPYGYRKSPFGSSNQFHSGIDIGASMGSPVRAAMSGRVSAVGWDDVLGNYVVVSHHSGYRTMYAHLNAVRTKSGAYVGTGERIGDVGSTGLSTGPHLHFTVFKSGVTVNPRSLMK